MKNKLRILYMLMGIALLFTACKPDEYQLGELITKADLKYSVTPSTSDPNMIILKSLTPGASPLWITPLGRSLRMDDTVRIAFPGDYKFVYGVQSAGGFVQADTFKLSITTTNLSYVNDPLWTLLTGGPGHEKTWFLDLNSSGKSKYFAGPMYFYGTDDSWTTIEMLAAGKSYDQIKAELGIKDAWNWSPDYPGNSWLMPTGDYGSMTFSLKGSPVLTSDHKMIAKLGQQTGTYFLDVTKKTLTTTNASILHNEGNDGKVVDWGKLKLMSLTENSMQLAALRDQALSGEGPCLFVYNFISKTYSDNWAPPVIVPKFDDGYNPTFKTGEILAMLAGTAGQARRWKLDAAGNPVDWVGKGKGWTTKKGDSETWGWNADWDAVAAGSWIEFDRFGGQHFTKNQKGVITSGTFTVDDKTNEVTLSEGNTLIISEAASWLDPKTNVLKIVKGWPADYNSKGVWFGTSYDANKDEWIVFHYVPMQKK